MGLYMLLLWTVVGTAAWLSGLWLLGLIANLNQFLAAVGVYDWDDAEDTVARPIGDRRRRG